MRTTVNVSDDLLREVMRESGTRTITQAIRSALEGYLLQRKRIRLIKSLGKFPDWHPDLRGMRRQRDLG